jgi:4-amino-4-deoxy-L-arabinose transferase-like glycosyltransferase
LATFGLEGQPSLGFDESYYLQFARNLINHGQYVLVSPPQESDWFGLGNSSPTLVLPIAVSFKFLGIGVTQGRLVAALYLIGTVVAIYLLMRHLYGWPIAMLSAALFLSTGPTSLSLFESGTLIGKFNTIWMGRKILGEVPALFFLLLGSLFWFRSWETRSKSWLIGAGLLFGLALVTKEQFLPWVILAFGLVWLADRLYYRKLRFYHFALLLVATGMPIGLWYGYKLLVLGPEAFVRHLNTLSQVSRASTWAITPGKWAGYLNYLYYNFFFFLGLPAILYTLALSIRRELISLKLLFLTLLATEFLVWFVFLSNGWTRYAFPGLALASLLAAKPLADLVDGLLIAPSQLLTRLRDGEMARPVVAAIFIFLMIGYPLQDIVRQTLFDRDYAPQEFAAFVEAHTESEALIESFDWQVEFLTTRRYHHPPPEVFVQLLENAPDRSYNPLVYQPDYIIDGPYAKGNQLYPVAWLRECCRKVGTVGNFDLYAVVDNEP